MTATSTIPQPKTYGPLGNLPLIDRNNPTMSLCKLADEHGPIYRLSFPGYSSLMISGHDLAADVCDTNRFDKVIFSELENVRAFAGDGLFTAHTDEPNWKKAHQILLPAFSQQAMKGYHAMMVDIAQQLVEKWKRLNPGESVDVPEDMTRLTLDTIGLCGFNYRFNSFYRETHNPFVISMVRALNEAMHQSGRLAIQNMLMLRTRRQYEEDIRTMFSLVDQMIADRKADLNESDMDLLARMLEIEDPDTGEKLDDENIRFQIITFLIAGHETTSGLLSFALYFLLKHPEALRQARAEADEVLRGDSPTYEQVQRLNYVRMVLQEALRLWPTAPGFEVYAKEDTVIGGKYAVRKGENVGVLLPQLHRDKRAWGDDAEQFRPERFADPEKVPNHAYKPFGNGQRACIGMQFAMHEATLVLGMILRHFELIDHMNYQLQVKQTLTIKPGDFHMRVRARSQDAFAEPRSEIERAQGGRPFAVPERLSSGTAAVAGGPPLLILHGSQLGTAEAIAQELAEEGRALGFAVLTAPLNAWAGKLPTAGVALIITATYNGKPPRSAREFTAWLEQAAPGSLAGVRFAVFGCGDRTWAQTYQQVPRYIDARLEELGAERLSPRGEADAAADHGEALDAWRKRVWADVRQAFGLSAEAAQTPAGGNLRVRFIGSGAEEGQLRPPAGNTAANVDRALRRYGLDGSEPVVVAAEDEALAAHLPLQRTLPVGELLRRHVDLQRTATREQLRRLAAVTVCPPHQRELEAMAGEQAYQSEIADKGVSMLDLLIRYEACQLPFETFLELLSPLEAGQEANVG